MAYIGHRCRCGHGDANHRVTDSRERICTANGGQSCGRGCRRPNTASLHPTWSITGRSIEEITPPGTRRPAWPEPTCSCDACWALYTELTGTAPAAAPS